MKSMIFPGALPQAILISPRWGFPPGALPQCHIVPLFGELFSKRLVAKATTTNYLN